MKPCYEMSTFKKQLEMPRISKRNAYHIAGRIASTHIGNKQKDLPSIHFRVTAKPLTNQVARIAIASNLKATLEDGRLISVLPPSFSMATRRLADEERHRCRTAFEADVVNLLAGPLAEAKYVALRDDEVFNANLIYLGALKFYGGATDLMTVDEYMYCLYPDDETERQGRLAELFLEAYSFVNNLLNWPAIVTVAEYLACCSQSVIECEDLIEMLEGKQTNAFRFSPPVMCVGHY